ncbi:MAG: hypothetical protein ABIS03_14020 [Gemmatimonadaceae bacterium]
MPLDRGAATGKSPHFLRISNRDDPGRYVGWNPSQLPAPVAFRPATRVSPGDSAAFWSILRKMETDIGISLFVPAVLPPDSDPVDVIIVDVRRFGPADGMTMATWSTNGMLYDARVNFRSVDRLRNSRIVTHEMMHALGFGHTSAWRSVMNSSTQSVEQLTLEDVAYAQLAFQSRASSELFDFWERLTLAGFVRAPDTPRLTR